MKKIVRLLSFVAALFSIIWMISSNFGYEPIIVFITSLIGVITTSESNASSARMTGKRNKVFQKSNPQNSNNADVSGEDNQLIQM